MSRNSVVGSTILFACVVALAYMVLNSAPSAGEQQDDPTQQVAPRQEEPGLITGAGAYNSPFRIVYLRKDGNWGKPDCITVFPDPAGVYDEPGKKPNKIWWVILDKQEGHVWEMIAKHGYDEDDLKPHPRVIPEQKNMNSFKSNIPKAKGMSYDWHYKVQVKEENADCSQSGSKCCELDPQIKVSG